MKYIAHSLLIAMFTLALQFSFSQDLNWKALQPAQKHIINLNVGFDNAAVIGIGYGYHFNTNMPLVLNLEYSEPFGNKIFDDFKTKIGGQLNLVRANNFFATVKAYGIMRRYGNDFVRMINFGSEFSLTAGYYKTHWYITPEIGFDKAIVTHIKHSELAKQYNPGLQSGWYIPTGGNLFYGLQGGYSFKNSDIYAKAGKTLSQDFKTAPQVPYYFQLGWIRKW